MIKIYSISVLIMKKDKKIKELDDWLSNANDHDFDDNATKMLKNYEEVKNSKKNDYFFPKVYIRLFTIFISIGIVTSFSRIGNFLLFITMLFYLLNEILYVKKKNYSKRKTRCFFSARRHQ